MYILSHFPPQEELAIKASLPGTASYKVNGHIHTPYSFSAFSGVSPIFEMAIRENVKILGINDFYVTEGYSEFYENALKNRIFPLFNIEFIALDRDMQKRSIRINDPNNPGRTYLSGKGLDYPARLGRREREMVESVKNEGHRQIGTMIDKTNALLSEKQIDIRLDFTTILNQFARGLVRERHVAKALRINLFSRFKNKEERIKILTLLYDGREPKANPEDAAATEMEIRNNLLKAGGRAFVEEDEKAFLTIAHVIEIITGSGGIPCYPVLLDDAKGNLTDFESDYENLYRELKSRKIFCIELIPGRNDFRVLKDFVGFFREKGFIILFGTEHNTPELIPLTISCRHGVALDAGLKQVTLDGACAIAAHQYYRAKGYDSPVIRWSGLDRYQKEKVLQTGHSVIDHFINH
ncbi:MAG: PHP domain-containing protein [Bacteroidota bacterium]